MISKYGFIGFLKLTISYFYTRFFFKKVRLIRLPFDIRNQRYISLGDSFTSGVGCRLEAYPVNIKDPKKILVLGKNVQINDYVHITSVQGVYIGDNVLMASKVYISDSSHGSYSGDQNDSSPESIPSDRPLFAKEVFIEDNVWLGEFVSVLPGVTIGKGTIVGANSVVTKTLPANVIAVGTPAKPIKKYNFESRRWENIKLQKA